jgi:hypothetical protein
MTQLFCDTHGGYNNYDMRCLFCDYDKLALSEKKRCHCSVTIKWGLHANFIKDFKVKKCYKHAAMEQV